MSSCNHGYNPDRWLYEQIAKHEAAKTVATVKAVDDHTKAAMMIMFPKCESCGSDTFMRATCDMCEKKDVCINCEQSNEFYHGAHLCKECNEALLKYVCPCCNHLVEQHYGLEATAVPCTHKVPLFTSYVSCDCDKIAKIDKKLSGSE